MGFHLDLGSLRYVQSVRPYKKVTSRTDPGPIGKAITGATAAAAAATKTKIENLN